MLRCWCKILLKSDTVWRSYENMFRGLLFSRTQCIMCNAVWKWWHKLVSENSRVQNSMADNFCRATLPLEVLNIEILWASLLPQPCCATISCNVNVKKTRVVPCMFTAVLGTTKIIRKCMPSINYMKPHVTTMLLAAQHGVLVQWT